MDTLSYLGGGLGELAGNLGLGSCNRHAIEDRMRETVMCDCMAFRQGAARKPGMRQRAAAKQEE